jgi:hypothetical protein
VDIPTGGGPSTSVSCPSPRYCQAVNDDAGTNVYGTTGWRALKFIDLKGSTFLNSVSCASKVFCVAVDTYGYVSEISGGRWLAPVLVDPDAGTGISGGLTSVSCPDSTFCAAVDSTGHALVFSGTSWTSPQTVDADGINGVSCPASTFCVAVDNGGRALEYKG